MVESANRWCGRMETLFRGGRAILAAGVLLALLPACSLFQAAEAQKQQGPPPESMAVPVRTAVAAQQAVPVELRTIGTVEPYSTVQVRSMVAGQLQKVHFKEGDRVEAGDVLFTIDPRPFEAVLRQAEANRARNQAQLELARTQVSRMERMVREGIGQQQELDQARTSAATLEAAILADEAAIARAKVDLGYTTIYAPLTGRTGDLAVDEGNLVKANDVPLVTINQISPANVVFSVPEQHLAEIRSFMATCDLPVRATAPGAEDDPATGTLTFINNTVSAETGTIQLKATFPNEDEQLWPGQFVQVVLTLTSRPDAVVVPAQAVQTGQEGEFVFVVKEDQTVEPRTVVVSDTVNGSLVVEEGLSAGETVVTEGHLRLAPGRKVTLAEARPAKGNTPS